VIVQGKRGDLVKAAKEVQLLEQRFRNIRLRWSGMRRSFARWTAT